MQKKNNEILIKSSLTLPVRAGVCRYFLEVWGAVWHFKIRYYPKSCL